MKKTSLATRNAYLSFGNAPAGTIALALVLVAFFLRLAAPNTFWYLVTPAFRAADTLSAKSHSLMSAFGDTTTLAAKNERLMNENAALASENNALLQKNADLAALLGVSPAARASARGIVAGIVARPPQSPYDTLVLAAGSKDGVRIGQEAFGEGGTPIGVVSSVLPNFSRATLFSAPGMVTGGWVGRAGTALTLTGTGGGTVVASMPRPSHIEAGETVFVPGPGKLPFGTVVRVDGDPSSPTAIVRIRPALNLFSASWVLLRDTGAGLSSPLCSATSTLL